MSDVVFLLTALLSVLVIALIGLIVWKGRSPTKASADEDQRPRQPRGVPLNRENEPARRGGRRVPARRAAGRIDEENEEDDYDPLADEIAMPDGKIGAKKRAKLEAKAEKRIARERELEEREERKQRQAQLDEERKLLDDKEKDEETKRLEEERRIKEEKERQEQEEYLKMKEAFAVEEEGFEEDDDDSGSSNKLQQFIEYIQNQKVVLLEDLAGHFQMKTQDAINRVQDLLAQDILVGVIDDRGKFIHITREELGSVAKFIRQRGRVSITDLVESSNSLINLQPVV